LPPAALELLDPRAAEVAAAALDDVLLVHPAPAAAARGRAAIVGAARRRSLGAGAAEAPKAAAPAQREDGAISEVDAQLCVVAVRDRAPRVRRRGAEHAAGRPQVLRLADAHALGQAEVDGQRRAVGERD